MKVSDYIAEFLVQNEVRHVFGLQGGAVVHLFDSLERTSDVSVIYCHHEQSAALAAVSNAKVTGKLGCAIVTTGPGCSNAITGLLAAWQDSVPVIYISGQTRVEHTSYGKPVRQVGSQEFNILDVVRPITKYSKLIENVQDVPSVLSEAVLHAISGRMGPVWIDIPVNLQWMHSDYVAPFSISIPEQLTDISGELVSQFNALIDMLANSSKPVIVAGNGIRAAGVEREFIDFIKTAQIPFVSTWTTSDLIETDNSLFGGIIGVAGQRGANKILYEADMILCLGCHLAITHTGTLFGEFAPRAKKAIIDIDRGELDNLNIEFNIKVHADLRSFFVFCGHENVKNDLYADYRWLDACLNLKLLNSVTDTLEDKSCLGDDTVVNSNYFNYLLTKRLPLNSHIVVDGGGTALYTGFQSSFLKRGQRIICSSAISAMGTGLPESIGVAFGFPCSTIYCIIGDGSLMLNLQELQTIHYHNLPVKIIIYNNSGYLAIKHTQKSFLDSRYFGTDAGHGVSIPDISRIAECFQISYLRVSGLSQVDDAISYIVEHSGPLLVEVVVSSDQEMLFQQGYRCVGDGAFQPCNLSEMQPYI
jgi:acetolactate synthase-1/2/3 large subunit